MIKYNLLCADDHEFEGWFRDSADYDQQSDRGLVSCPVCGDDGVRKAIMAPAIPRKGNSVDHNGVDGARIKEIRKDVMAAAEKARDFVEKNFDYVGEKFPDEARKIHYGESDERAIYGEASGKEVKDLLNEGVEIAALPRPARKADRAGKPKVPPVIDKKLN